MNTRRQFLKTAAGGSLVLSLAPTIPGLLLRSAVASPVSSNHDRVLVVIQLTGGNDGLNTVVPFADEVYVRSRPTLRLPTADLHRNTPELGLHPNMGAMGKLFAEGHLAVIQGVGCPGLSRDHERALRVWQTADPDFKGVDTGWLGRAADELWPTVRPAAPGVFVGDIPSPLGINSATTVIPSLRTAEEALPERLIAENSTAIDAAVPSSLLGHVQRSLVTMQAQARRLRAAVASRSSSVEYPPTTLGRDLRTVARLIRADLGIRIFHTEHGGGGIGGFDNHANQIGNHCALLKQLSEAVGALTSDLAAQGLLDRVLVLTFSEFGRTVAENGRRGTDHGGAGPMLLAGGRVRGGVLGVHPSLTDLQEGALKHHTDFRSVYATLLAAWLGLPAASILGGEFPHLQLLSST